MLHSRTLNTFKLHLTVPTMPSLLLLRNVIRSNALNARKISFSFPGSSTDFVVIGDNPGGLAAAKEAASLGARVAVVSPTSSRISTETYKKLMHQAALLGQALEDARGYGWQIDDNKNKISHNWMLLKSTICSHMPYTSIKADKNVQNIKGKCTFQDPFTLLTTQQEGEYNFSSKYFLIALRSAPRYPSFPGALENGVTTDEIFSMEKPPGKTLVIGAGHVGMELAGVLNGLGYDTTVMARSVPLRGLDQQMAAFVIKEMQRKGVKFLSQCLPKAVDKLTENLNIAWINSAKQIVYDQFDTVVFATGRMSSTKELNLQKAGVADNEIKINNDRTNVPHIYTIGDIFPEISIHAGKLLARRLFAHSKEPMDYENVPTTILTPLEYGFVGLSEETALQRHGEANLEVYHSFYKPAEFGTAKRDTSNCYLKVVALREGEQKVLGMHFVGPQAREVIQGFSTAMKCNLTVNALVNTIGIHPTVGEEFTRIKITKRSGHDPTPASCCS